MTRFPLSHIPRARPSPSAVASAPLTHRPARVSFALISNSPVAAVIRERKRSESSTGSEIGVQHDAVAGLARVKSGEGLVDRAHREVLGLRPNIVP